VGQWTITDATLSSDSQLLAYSSISPIVHVARTDGNTQQYAIDLSSHRLRRESRGFGIWSVRFSADNRELVAGTSSNSIYIYDLEKQSLVLAMKGHADDVNAVCFADESKNLLYSASDDSLIKVWDRRSLGTAAKPVGVLPGHTEGVTYVSARGDGRYAVSNGKDQTAKLWDVRKMVEPHVFDSWPGHVRDRRLEWDYRYQAYPLGPLGPAKYRHPKDASIVTMTGHSVLVTLIRVHFDPWTGTHIVTGSRDGIVRIYNLLGQCVRSLETHSNRMREGLFSDDEMELGFLHGWRRELVVRDVAWHPKIPLLLSTSWSADGGAVVQHTYE
jgi:WD repeat-containing protein 23